MKYILATGITVMALLGCGSDVQGVGGAGGGAGSTGTGGHGAASSASSGASGTGGASTGSASTGSAMGCGECTFTCCGSSCVNTDNDIDNCGPCGTKCPGPNPYCDKGKCGPPPCPDPSLCAAGALCCDNQCCKPGELCCTIPGPIGDMTTCTAPTETGTCPVGCNTCKCTSPETPIATPGGDRPIAALAPGDLVYSVDGGRVVAVAIRLATSEPAPNHVVMRVRLATGAVIEVSPRHPTADGRTFAELEQGGELDGVAIVEVRAVPFAHDRTYDILPDSDTGTYFAGGVLIGSTLAPNGALARAPHAPFTPAE